MKNFNTVDFYSFLFPLRFFRQSKNLLCRDTRGKQTNGNHLYGKLVANKLHFSAFNVFLGGSPEGKVMFDEWRKRIANHPRPLKEIFIQIFKLFLLLLSIA